MKYDILVYVKSIFMVLKKSIILFGGDFLRKILYVFLLKKEMYNSFLVNLVKYFVVYDFLLLIIVYK